MGAMSPSGAGAAPPGARRGASAALGLALAVALAVALRAWRLRQGLPDFLDEAIPLKEALEMWGWETGRTDLNPRFFHYPTLSIYLHFLLQKLTFAAGWLLGRFASPADYRLLYEIDPSGVVIAARALSFAADALTVAAVWRAAERLRAGAGLPAALLAAASPTLIETARAVHADTIMAALLAWAVERMLAWRQEGRRDQLLAAVALTGLAAGAKYTAGLLVLPLGWVVAERALAERALAERAPARGARGAGGAGGGAAAGSAAGTASGPPRGLASRLPPGLARGLGRAALAAAGALAAFLLSSPYVALDFGGFWRDFAYEGRHMAAGHLGALDRTGAAYYGRRLLVEPGPLGLLLALSTLAWLRRPGPARGAAACVWLALAPQLAALAAFRMEAARYLLPALPLAAALAAAGGKAALAAGAARLAGIRRPARRLAALALWAALLLPTLGAGLRAAAAGRDTTQQQARRWLEAHLAPARDVIVMESYGPVLRNAFQQDVVRRGNSYAAASPAVRERFDAAPTWRAVTLPMAVSGRLGVVLERPGSPPRTATVFPHASALNEVFYEPALLAGVDWFIASGAVERRYRGDRPRYPRQNAFYDLLAARAERAAVFAPGGGVGGPEITIWRLGDAFQAATAAELDPFWWAAPVPAAFRDEADRYLAPPAEASGGAVRLPDGRLAPWLASLREPFEKLVLPFAVQTAHHLSARGRDEPARRLAAAVLAYEPEDVPANLIHSLAASRAGAWREARAGIERGLAALARAGRDSPDLRLELARLLAVTGEREAARAELGRVLGVARSGTEAARAARDMLADLEAGRVPLLAPGAAGADRDGEPGRVRSGPGSPAKSQDKL